MNQVEIKLMRELASHLAGRPVNLRLQQPYIADADGLALRHKGAAYVDLRPDLADADIFANFLHELAHIRRQWDTIPDRDNVLLPPGSQVFTQTGLKQHSVDPREPEAQALAAEWLAYAERDAWVYERGGASHLEAQLKALAKWPVKLIDKSTLDAIAKAAVRDLRLKGWKP